MKKDDILAKTAAAAAGGCRFDDGFLEGFFFLGFVECRAYGDRIKGGVIIQLVSVRLARRKFPVRVIVSFSSLSSRHEI